MGRRRQHPVPPPLSSGAANDGVINVVTNDGLTPMPTDWL
jgi:hypothetical protein